ncbi:hypothetical protein LguiB_005752 [Lonicera macranthoides]
MLLLEMVRDRKYTDIIENTSQLYFPEWIYDHLNKENELHIRIKEDGYAIVGLLYIQCYPGDHPSIKTAIQILEGKLVVLRQTYWASVVIGLGQPSALLKN